MSAPLQVDGTDHWEGINDQNHLWFDGNFYDYTKLLIKFKALGPAWLDVKCGKFQIMAAEAEIQHANRFSCDTTIR